jgi:hypothetical protein
MQTLEKVASHAECAAAACFSASFEHAFENAFTLRSRLEADLAGS